MQHGVSAVSTISCERALRYRRVHTTQIISSDLISSELGAVIGRSHGDWVASQRTTQFAVDVTDHGALS